MTTATPATTPTGSSSITGGMAVGGVAQAGVAICGAFQAGFGNSIQSDIMDIQKQSAINAIKHDETMAFKTMEGQLDQLINREENVLLVGEMHGKALAAQEGLKKAEGEQRVAEKQLAEAKLTQKQGATKDVALRKIFADYRGQYPLGSAK